MVAIPTARGVRAAAALLALLVLVPTLPPAAAQLGGAAGDASLNQGDATFTQTGLGKTTSFLSSTSNTATVTTKVFWTGLQQANRVPVYMYLADGAIVRSQCTEVSLLARAANEEQSERTVSWTFDTGDLPNGAYNMTIAVGIAPPKPERVSSTCGVPLAADPDGGADNVANAYFVKGYTLDLRATAIRWCKGSPSGLAAASGCDEAMHTYNTDGSVAVENGYNMSAPSTANRPTFLEVDVASTGSWVNLTDYGAPGACRQPAETGCDGAGFSYVPNVTIKGPYIQGAQNLTAGEARVNKPARSLAFPIQGHAGDYNVTVRLDLEGRLRSPTTTAAVAQRTINIGYREFVSAFDPTGLKTTSADPYPADAPFTLRVNVSFKNLGRQAFSNTGATADDDRDLKWRIYVVNESQPQGQEPGFVMTGSNDSFPGNSEFSVQFSKPVSPTGGQSSYLAPGRHTIRAEIDSVQGDATKANFGQDGNVTFELDDFNNVASIDFFIRDQQAPSFLTAAPKITVGVIGNPAATELRPHETFNLWANVTDDDRPNLKVVANFTLDSNASVYKRYEMADSENVNVPNAFVVQVSNFTFAANETGENWTVSVNASDLFGNAVSSASAKFRLVPWGIASASREFVVVDSPDAKDITWGGDEEPRWTIRVMPNATGIPNQRSYVDNIGMHITTPQNRTYTSVKWQDLTRCVVQGGNVPSTDTIIGDQEPPEESCTDTDLFGTTFSKRSDEGGPGKWNYSIIIKDRANLSHFINGSFVIVDALPQIREQSFVPSEVDPGQNFTVKANLTDDFSVAAAYLNFTRVVPNDGLAVNLTLKLDTRPGEGRSSYEVNQTFQAGRGKAFGIGGKFDVKLAVVDENDNWNSTSLGPFTLNDTDTPTLTAAGVSPAVQEVGQNVTFFATARDQTNVTIKLQVLRLSEEVFPAVLLKETGDGNFTYTANFSAENSYDWLMTAIDSTGRSSDVKKGSITIRDNLGPKFEVRSPGAVIDAVRYGSGTPRIEALVHDTEGVVASSIEMSVGGVVVQPDILPATGSQGGYIVSYTVPATKKFAHRDVVQVNLTAYDNSAKRLRGDLNFTFTVDDVAPVARVVSIAPSYRDQPSQPLNISLNTRITLAAEDNDGLPTIASAIRFRILGGGNNAAETIYTGPFKITDAPGVYTGPRPYTIQFWAEDSVGNFNRAFNVTTVYVDDTPPALYQFFPQGRYINATFVDDQVGVNRSVAWYRLNNDPYIPLPLVENAGVWSIALPGGVKGDRISYYLQAWDRLDNTDTFGTAAAPYASFNVSNQEPKVKIKAPLDGARIGRTIDLTWDASDDDNDALVFTLYYKQPGKTTFTELVRLENTDVRRYSIDTTRFPDGVYSLRVAASDGAFVKLSDVSVTIINRGTAVGNVDVDGGALPGETALITAEITKAQATVEARLYRDGKLVDAFPMNDLGEDGDVTANDGIYSARVPIADAGDYSVEIFSRYQEDGELKESTFTDAATFSTSLTPGYILTEYATILALIGLLAAVGIGVAVFVVIRRR